MTTGTLDSLRLRLSSGPVVWEVVFLSSSPRFLTYEYHGPFFLVGCRFCQEPHLLILRMLICIVVLVLNSELLRTSGEYLHIKYLVQFLAHH